MEPEFKSASWIPAYYGQDQSFAKGLRDVLFFVPGEVQDFALSFVDGAIAVKTMISSIFHPDYGEIEGVYNDGLDLYIVCSDGKRFIVNGEENPGEIHDASGFLSSQPFTLELRNPIVTGVTIEQYSNLFILETRKLMREFSEERIKKHLQIS